MKLAIILGILLFSALVLGCIKLGLDKRRIAKNSNHQELEDGERGNGLHLSQRQRDNWGHHGIRTTERGSHVVCQSRPTTAADSERTSFEDSESITTRTNKNKLHGVPTNLSGTTLDSLETLKFPPKSLSLSKTPKRSTLNFGTLSASSFHNTELKSQAGRPATSAGDFHPTLQVTQSPQTGSANNHIGTQNRPISDTTMLATPLSSSPFSLVSQDWMLSPARANWSMRSVESKLPTLPPPTARRQSRSPFKGQDEGVEGPWIQEKSEETPWSASFFAPFDFSSFEPWTKSYRPAPEPEVQVPPEESSSPTRSIESDDSDDSVSDSASRPLASHSDSSTVPDFMTHLQFPTQCRHASVNSLDRTFDSVKIKHAKNFSKDLATEKETGSGVEQQKDQTNSQNTKLSPTSKPKESDSAQTDSADLNESPFSDNKALRDSPTRNSSISSSKSTEDVPKQPSTAGLRDAMSVRIPTPTISISRHRSDSEDSMCSISEMYGVYLKRATLATPSVDRDEAGLFDLGLGTEQEQQELEKREEKKKSFLCASMAVPGAMKKKSPPASLILDKPKGKFVPRAIESPVSKWKI